MIFPQNFVLGNQPDARPSPLFRPFQLLMLPVLPMIPYILVGKFQLFGFGLSHIQLFWCTPESAAVRPCALPLHVIPRFAGSTYLVPIVDLPSFTCKSSSLGDKWHVIPMMWDAVHRWNTLKTLGTWAKNAPTRKHVIAAYRPRFPVYILGNSGKFIPFNNKHGEKEMSRPCIHLQTVFKPGIGGLHNNYLC